MTETTLKAHNENYTYYAQMGTFEPGLWVCSEHSHIVYWTKEFQVSYLLKSLTQGSCRPPWFY